MSTRNPDPGNPRMNPDTPPHKTDKPEQTEKSKQEKSRQQQAQMPGQARGGQQQGGPSGGQRPADPERRDR